MISIDSPLRLSASRRVHRFQQIGRAGTMRRFPQKRPDPAISGLVIASQDRHRHRIIIAVFGHAIQIHLCSIAVRHAA
ncbi:MULTISPECIES: hypothetical protein [unclassified Bradyrhizobium]|uniref:hypothetical protein n=1 Tax=unclassified Bradyrhizobium TaxID=2631580 RepID=UPI0028EDC7FD|nr:MULTISPECIES: hypothetical protein [unclassified Bradyrhizobium]